MNEPKNEPVKWLVILIACFVIVWGICWWATVYLIEGWPNRSAFGEMFGSINTLFSGAALAGVIYAIFLQRRELQLQRNELELTRDELRRSAEAQEKSEVALREQIKEMQEQTELQLLPFVILIKGAGANEYILWNAGNGTALNIRIVAIIGSSCEPDLIECSNKTSILTKDQKDVVDDTSLNYLEYHIFNIIFQNVNKKEYSVSGRLIDGMTQIIEYGPRGSE